ncbi:DUF927 domain-containing protein [Magnetospirillum sp. 15-1]|uniref:phage NrS-1 polymerase family protein n=1 Tax=Magnetospirillum sp. 15-1 TaxID=1979370 RepID=UPI000BBB76E3|nr:DUF927 domain-containing protein [Magnetospirillum sp. 15-1]
MSASIIQLDRSPLWGRADHAALVNRAMIRHHLAGVLSLPARGTWMLCGYAENPTTGEKLSSKIMPIIDLDSAVETAAAWAVEPHRNVYISAATMTVPPPPGQRGAEVDINHVGYLVCDFDDLDAANWASRIPGACPTFVIESSPGRFQVGFSFDRPVGAEEAKPLARGLKALARCDHGSADIAHVWRVPGCLNWPNAKKAAAGRPLDPAAVVATIPWTGALHDPAGLRAVLPAEVPPPPGTRGFERDIGFVDGPSDEWDGPSDDAALLRIALNSRTSWSVASGDRCSLKRLIPGDPLVLKEHFDNDPSRLDAALAQHLSFWTGKDGKRIERIMRNTIWVRPKWDDRDDYLPRTISKACSRQVEVYNQSRHSPNPVPVKGNTTFRLTDTGVEKKTEVEDKITLEKKDVWNLFCTRLEVLADTRSHDGKNWGRLLRITDRDGNTKTWAMPMALMAGEGAAYREPLFDLGLVLFPVKGAKTWLDEYLTTVQPDAKARCVSRIGWHGRAFVLPDATLGDTAGEQVVLQGATDHAFRTGGTLDGWRDGVARLAVGNSRLALAIAAGFAAPLLHLVDAESGGFHFRGPSSTGKSTALIAAGSVWGGGDVRRYVRSWRATDNALEAVALNHSDALLCVDEMAEVTPPAAAAAAYMLSNGMGKSRATKTGDARAASEWRTLFLSSGEISLGDKIAEDGRGRKAAAGQQARLVDIAADAGVGYGLYEYLHGLQAGNILSDTIKAAATEHYGHAARAFLELLTADLDGAIAAVTTTRNAFLQTHCPPGSDGQVSRVAARFGLVAAAGELAAAWCILPWPTGEAMRAAATCFRAWCDGRGGIGAAEDATAISTVRRFIEQHGGSRFEPMDAAGTVGIPNRASDHRIVNRAGFRRPTADGGTEFIVLPEVWKSEVCQGLDATAVAKTLVHRGLLIGQGGKLQGVVRLPGNSGPSRVYVITSSILSGE